MYTKQPELDKVASVCWHSGKVEVMLNRQQHKGFLKSGSLRPLDCLVFSLYEKYEEILTKHLTSEAMLLLLVEMLGKPAVYTGGLMAEEVREEAGG